MEDAEYELMPHEELEYLRKELSKVKRNPLGDTQASITLLNSINKLNENILKLTNIFEGANDEMVKAFNEASMQEQIVKMMEQQEKLARGIVAVAELVKAVEEKVNRPIPLIEQFAPPKLELSNESVTSTTGNYDKLVSASTQSQAMPIKQANPFEDIHQEYQPINDKPLYSADGSMRNQKLPPPPIGQNIISDMDVPPPPPRRQ